MFVTEFITHMVFSIFYYILFISYEQFPTKNRFCFSVNIFYYPLFDSPNSTHSGHLSGLNEFPYVEILFIQRWIRKPNCVFRFISQFEWMLFSKSANMFRFFFSLSIQMVKRSKIYTRTCIGVFDRHRYTDDCSTQICRYLPREQGEHYTNNLGIYCIWIEHMLASSTQIKQISLEPSSVYR